LNPDLAVWLAPAIPVIGAVLIGVTGTRPNLREAMTLGTSGILFLVVLSIYPAVAAGSRPAALLFTTLPGLPIALEVEPLGMLFGLVASGLWIVTSVYSIGYMRGHNEPNQTRFYVCFAIAIASAIGVAFAGNMFTLFIFYEVLTLSTYPLVTHSGTDEAKRAGRLYLGILLGTSIGLQLLAIVWTWAITGTLDFVPGGILTDAAPPLTLGILFTLYVLGMGKAALMPFHRWLPAAMVAPTPVSALLHAVAVVKAGVFAILKVTIYLFGLDLLASSAISHWLAYLAALTILLASIVAMTRDNLKARLAYSTISQLSYVVLGALLANAWGVIGGGLHIVMHAFGKITLFFCAGAIMVTTHKTEISEMGGLGRTMPITMAAFLVGALSIIGLPPMGGMWSKWYLAFGAVEAEQLLLLGVLMASSLFNIAYLLPIPLRAFFGAPQPGQEGARRPAPAVVREAPAFCLIALVVTALGCIWLFFNPDPFYRLMDQIVNPDNLR
jgi:multicomponent Na+:H+ antiporter subunit D